MASQARELSKQVTSYDGENTENPEDYVDGQKIDKRQKRLNQWVEKNEMRKVST